MREKGERVGTKGSMLKRDGVWGNYKKVLHLK